MRLRAGITVWLVLLVLLPLLPLVAFSVFSAYRYADGRREAIEVSLVQKADALAGELRDRLSRILGQMNSLALSDAAQGGDLEALYRSALRVQASNPDLSAITLIGPGHEMLFFTLRPFGETVRTSQTAAVQKVFDTGRPAISSPFKSPTRDRMVVALGVPVMAGGRVAYCLRAIVPTEVLSGIVHADHLPPGWIASVVDAEGVLVGRSHQPLRFVGEQASPLLVEALRDGKRGLWEGVSKEGVRTQTVLRPIGDWGWQVGLGVPKATLNEPLHREVSAFVAAGLALLLLGVGAAWWLSQRLRGAMSDTVRSAQAVLAGETPAGRQTGIDELDRMHEALTRFDEYGRLLEQRVALRTAELVEARDRIATFAIQLEDAVESERRRISREVHDQIGAVLTGIKLIFRSLPAGRLDAAQERSLIEALDAGVATARRIAAELRPPLIDDLGLQAAVEQLLERTFRDSGVVPAVRLHDFRRLSERQVLGVYRIVQEAATNALRYAAARHFVVDGRVDGDAYEVTMMDDGVGMASTAVRAGAMGLLGMRERAELLGGSLDVTSRSRAGVLLTLHLPLASRVADAPDEDPAA